MKVVIVYSEKSTHSFNWPGADPAFEAGRRIRSGLLPFGKVVIH